MLFQQQHLTANEIRDIRRTSTRRRVQREDVAKACNQAELKF
jgi:hypothetical protein